MVESDDAGERSHAGYPIASACPFQLELQRIGSVGDDERTNERKDREKGDVESRASACRTVEREEICVCCEFPASYSSSLSLSRSLFDSHTQPITERTQGVQCSSTDSSSLPPVITRIHKTSYTRSPASPALDKRDTEKERRGSAMSTAARTTTRLSRLRQQSFFMPFLIAACTFESTPVFARADELFPPNQSLRSYWPTFSRRASGPGFRNRSSCIQTYRSRRARNQGSHSNVLPASKGELSPHVCTQASGDTSQNVLCLLSPSSISSHSVKHLNTSGEGEKVIESVQHLQYTHTHTQTFIH